MVFLMVMVRGWRDVGEDMIDPIYIRCRLLGLINLALGGSGPGQAHGPAERLHADSARIDVPSCSDGTPHVGGRDAVGILLGPGLGRQPLGQAWRRNAAGQQACSRYEEPMHGLASGAMTGSSHSSSCPRSGRLSVRPPTYRASPGRDSRLSDTVRAVASEKDLGRDMYAEAQTLCPVSITVSGSRMIVRRRPRRWVYVRSQLMTHRSHYMPKRGPGGSAWGKAAANKSAWGKNASGTQPAQAGPDSLPQAEPTDSPTPPSTSGPADGATVEPGNDLQPEGVREDGRIFVRTQR